MANLKEENKWEEGIYQLEVTDPVVGGIDGISNKQAKQLANRTKFLKESIDTLVDGKLGKEETAVDSDKLDGLDSSAFAQLAKENTFTKNLTIGSEGILHAKPDGSPVWHFFTHEGFKTDAGVNAGILKIKGVNTDEIYLKKDDDAFSNSKSENGYTRLPNGLIVQWGLALVEKGDNTTPTLFPIAFPNRCLNVTATHLGLDRNVSAIIVGGTMTAASVTFRHNWEHTATHISYLAIGY